MTDPQQLRDKQDHLLQLADRLSIPYNHHIDDYTAAPTLADLESYIYPDWEAAIERCITALEARVH